MQFMVSGHCLTVRSPPLSGSCRIVGKPFANLDRGPQPLVSQE
jgi:hypothetical protein